MANDAASLSSGGRDTRNALWGRKLVATWLKQPCPAQFAEVATVEIPSRADFMERPSLPAIWRFRQRGLPRQYGAPDGMAGGAPISIDAVLRHRGTITLSAYDLIASMFHLLLHLIPAEQGGVLFPSLSSRYWAAPMWRAIWDTRRSGGKETGPPKGGRPFARTGMRATLAERTIVSLK